MRESFVFTRLYLPRPLDVDTVTSPLQRLAGSDIARPIVFEVHADMGGVTQLLGCPSSAVSGLHRLLAGYLPGLQFQAATRADVAAVGRITARPTGLPFMEVNPEQVLVALYQALAARHGDEVVALQLVLGAAHGPAVTVASPRDPLQPLGSLLLNGARPASTETRRRLSAHDSQTRFDAILRIGVTAGTSKRRTALVWEVFGALQQLESPGMHFTLVKESPARWSNATTSRTGALRLTVTEVVPLLGWPVGERDYAGVAGTHPKLLPVPEIVTSTDSVFALGTAPGPERPVGIDPQSRLQHLVVLGPTGSGKSTLLEHLILSDITAGRPSCVIEPKSQLVDRILQITPAEFTDRIVLLDATDMGMPVGFNPLDVGDRDADIAVDGILASLAAVFKDSWGPRTEYLIQGALLSLVRAGAFRGEPYTLIDLPRLFTDAVFRRPIVAAVQDDVTLAAFWAEFDALSPGQRAAQLASPLNKLRKIVLRKPLVAVLGQSRPRFRLRDIFRHHQTVLVPLNDSLLGTGASRLLGSLLVAELWAATLERATETNPMKRPGMVVIDEVQNYLNLPTPIEDVLATSRSYGVGWTLAHQYRNQLPGPLRTALDVNARSKICFALEPDDARDMARLAPDLTQDDFQTLPERNIYARLIAGGARTPWLSARTLPPLPAQGNEQLIRDSSRDAYGAIPDEPEPTAPSTSTLAAPDGGERRSNQKARRP